MRYLLIVLSVLCALTIVGPAKAFDPSTSVEKFEFKNAEITTVIEAIGKLTGRNYVVDPGVRGKITITQNQKINLGDAYKAFLSALAANGYTVVENGKHWQVRATRNAQRDNIEVIINKMPPEENRMMTLYITLNHISAEEVNKNLRIIPSKDGEMAPFPPDNALVISDYGPNLIRVWKIIKQIDQPPSKEREDLLKQLKKERQEWAKQRAKNCEPSKL